MSVKPSRGDIDPAGLCSCCGRPFGELGSDYWELQQDNFDKTRCADCYACGARCKVFEKKAAMPSRRGLRSVKDEPLEDEEDLSRVFDPYRE